MHDFYLIISEFLFVGLLNSFMNKLISWFLLVIFTVRLPYKTFFDNYSFRDWENNTEGVSKVEPWPFKAGSGCIIRVVHEECGTNSYLVQSIQVDFVPWEDVRQYAALLVMTKYLDRYDVSATSM